MFQQNTYTNQKYCQRNRLCPAIFIRKNGIWLSLFLNPEWTPCIYIYFLFTAICLPELYLWSITSACFIDVYSCALIAGLEKVIVCDYDRLISVSSGPRTQDILRTNCGFGDASMALNSNTYCCYYWKWISRPRRCGSRIADYVV